MTQLDAIFKFNYNKMQKIATPNLFKPSTDRPGPAAKSSVLRNQPAVLTKKRSTALPPLDVSQTAPYKKRHVRPPKKRDIKPMITLAKATDVEAEDLNHSLQTLYPVRRRR